jgi:Domain of unknown function (DUF4383)
MVKTAAVIFGIVFLAVGILGFVPGVTTNDMLLGIFMVNAAHSVVHIGSGIIFLIAGMASAAASRMWFRIFGVVYALVAILGFMTPNGMLLGLISNNVADTWLHVILAVAMLFLGFVAKDTAAA